MSVPRLPEAVARALATGMTVLTPGQRAAHALRAFCEDPEPALSSLGGWLQHLWTAMTLAGDADRMLLNRAQEAVLWRRAIAGDPAVSGLGPASLLELAASAYATLQLHRGRPQLAAYAQSSDSKAFLRWTDNFEQMLREQRACTSAKLPGLLADAIARGTVPLSHGGLLLVDFDEMLPAHAALFAQIERAGYSVESLQTALAEPVSMTLAADDAREEMVQAARWLRARLDRDPEARLALVVPHLEGMRPALERVLGEILLPAERGLRDPAEALPYEFSLGTPLSQASPAACAFGLLRLAQAAQPLAAVSALLLSPVFGASGTLAERLAIAEFDAQEVRAIDRLRPELSLDALLRMALRSKLAPQMARWIERLRALGVAAQREHLPEENVRQPYTRWAEGFRAVLEAAGWTEARTANSFHFQVHRRWESALDELATLDFDQSRPTAAEALHALTGIAQSTVFAPESRGANVQVMGPLEAGGVPFDGLWFLGGGDLTWPANASTNPLLPRLLARQLRVAGSNPVDDHERGRRLTRRILGSAAESVVSFARVYEGQHQHLSAVMAGLTLATLEPAAAPPSPEPLAYTEMKDEAPRDPFPDRVARGGAGILEHQAACAFRAFAQYRLGSTQLSERTDGMDSLERGSLVHTVMQLFWQELGDQHELKQLTAEERTGFLDRCIAQALEGAVRQAETNWDHAYLRTQHLRLRSLLMPWLEFEMVRPAFAVRISEGKLDDVRIGPLRLNLRVDRIDETEQGELIVDYKTGNADPKEWKSARPDKPQLPVYAVLAPEPVAGVAFALLRPGKGLGMRGFADSDTLFGGKLGLMEAASFEEQVERWKETLTGLAEDFHRGVAEVRPKLYPQTCEYCAHRILCRVDPSLLADAEDEDDENPEAVHG